MPGAVSRRASRVLAHAGSAHARLLAAVAHDDPTIASLFGESLAAFLGGGASTVEKRRWQCAPQLIEALHQLAPACPALRAWDGALASGQDEQGALRLGRAKLGNVALPLRLAADPGWCGDIELASNSFGRIAFPGSPWRIVLAATRDGAADLLADTVLRLAIGRTECRLWLAGDDNCPAMILARDDCLRLVLGGASRLTRSIEFPHPIARPFVVRAQRLGRSIIRHEAIAATAHCPPPTAHCSHAATTASIVAALLRSIAACCPAIHRDLCDTIRTVRTFELPLAVIGSQKCTVQSFSSPSEPGVIGFNIPYSPSGEPHLSPLCFMWLGHELGHTKHYLIDDVLYGRGLAMLENPAEWTPPVARYGRPLRVATLFQISYVHLHEWALLMDFAERDFAGLPWNVGDEWRDEGDDISAEIADSFDLLAEYGQLTPLGHAAIDHLKRLADAAQARWQTVRARGGAEYQLA